MVVIGLPSAALTGITQERTAWPSTCTVHAPHSAMPQPYLVPVRPTCSRMAHSSGVLGSTLTSMELPLIVKRTIAFPPRIRDVSWPYMCTALRGGQYSKGRRPWQRPPQGRALHVMLGWRCCAPVDETYVPIQWRSTARHDRPRKVSQRC